jgi:hypothetical protein
MTEKWCAQGRTPSRTPFFGSLMSKMLSSHLNLLETDKNLLDLSFRRFPVRRIDRKAKTAENLYDRKE